GENQGKRKRGSGELAQETDVVVDEVADVGDAVQDHRQAVEAHAEGEAGHGLRIEKQVAAGLADGAEHGRIDHAAAGDLDPAVLASLGLKLDVDLEARLGER